MTDVIGYIIIGVGVVFDIFGSMGLVRFPDIYNRLQASTKSVTLGTCGIFFGIFLVAGWNPMGIKALICGAFLLLTSPVAAHAIARGAYKSGVKLWEGSIVDRYGEDTIGGPQIEAKNQ
jgi:multicomponent Na+:H+ antiporter subunit G